MGLGAPAALFPLAGALVGCGLGLYTPAAAVRHAEQSVVAGPGIELRAVALAAGGAHTCAIDDRGRVVCWGDDRAGQAGLEPRTDRTLPHFIALPESATAVAAGGRHTCALTASGAAWCWGANDFGQLGDGSRTWRTRPVRVKFDAPLASIAVGGDHSCALDRTGQAFCWGDQWDRAVGAYDAGGNVLEPMPVRRAPRLRSISGGLHHTCGVDVEGVVHCWGANVDGQAGQRRRASAYVSAPAEVPLPAAARSVSAGGEHSCALLGDGRVECWGRDRERALDTRTAAGSSAQTAQTEMALRPVTQLSVGRRETCAVTVGGAVQCWGGVRAVRAAAHVAAPPAEPTPFTLVSAGAGHVCALAQRGAVWCWGDNAHGQLGIPGAPSPPSPPTPVRVGAGAR